MSRAKVALAEFCTAIASSSQLKALRACRYYERLILLGTGKILFSFLLLSLRASNYIFILFILSSVSLFLFSAIETQQKILIMSLLGEKGKSPTMLVTAPEGLYCRAICRVKVISQWVHCRGSFLSLSLCASL